MIKRYLTAIFPLISVCLFLGGVFPLTVPGALGLAAVYLFSEKIGTGKRSRMYRIAAVSAYWGFLICITLIFSRIIIPFHPWLMIVSYAAAVVLAAWRKVRPEFSVGIVTNVATLVVFLMFTPPVIKKSDLTKLETEKRVRPIHMFFDSSKVQISSDRVRSPYEGVRSILIAPDDETVYFTADGSAEGPEGSEFRGLFRVSIGKGPRKEVSVWKSRLFGLALTPDGKELLATDYYGKKLLILDPGTLGLLGSREVSAYPQFIIMDPLGNRVTVSHEGKGTAFKFSLPDLKYVGRGIISGSPTMIVTDPERRTFFTSNWMDVNLLSEIEMYSLHPRRKKFLRSFASGGVDLDEKGRKVYVTDGLTGKFFELDEITFDILHVFHAPPLTRPVCADPRRKQVYTCGMVEPFLRIYGYDGKLKRKIYVGPDCRVISRSGKSDRIFVGTLLGLIEVLPDGL